MAEKENINLNQSIDNQVRDRNQKLFTSNFCDESLRNGDGQSFKNINEEKTPDSLSSQSLIGNGCDLKTQPTEDLHSQSNQNSEIDVEAVKSKPNENKTSSVIPHNSQTNCDYVSNNSETEASNSERKAFEVWRPFAAPSNNSREQPEIGNPLQTFSCNLCGRNYQSRCNLMCHIRTSHVRRKGFVCPTCGKEFHAKSQLTEHMRVHSTVRPFKCTICGNAYKYKCDLKLHVTSKHKAAGRFSCEICGKNFDRKNRLILHAQKPHQPESEKPFPCKICGKSFAYNSRLRVHQLVHMSERPFKCPKCDLRFKSEDRRREHVKRFHEARDKFYCVHCNKSYRYKSSLSVHIQLRHLYPDKK